MSGWSWKNHYRVGFGPEFRQSRARPGERFEVAFGASERKPHPLKEELLLAARLVAEATPLPIVVLFSGGIDSELTLRAFLAIGADVSAAIMVFENGLNSHDTAYAIDYCNKAGVSFRLHRLDLMRFWENEMFDYASISQCVSPQHAAHMWAFDQVDGFPVRGGGEMLPVRPSPQEEWICRVSERAQGAGHRFLHHRRRAGLFSFFVYTPELLYAYLAHPTIAALVRGAVPSIRDAAEIKFAMYASTFPDLVERPKYTGFEKVSVAEELARRGLDPLYAGWDDVWSISYRDLLTTLSPRPSR